MKQRVKRESAEMRIAREVKERGGTPAQALDRLTGHDLIASLGAIQRAFGLTKDRAGRELTLWMDS